MIVSAGDPVEVRGEGFRYYWVSPWNEPTVQRVMRQMIPGTIGIAAFQINVLVTQSFSFWFDPTIVSTFNYSVRLMELPQGMFGISLATYLLPTLSGLASEKKYPEFRHTLSQGLSYLAQKLLPPEVVAKLPTAPEHMRQSFAEDSRWWSQNLAAVTERWNAMMSRQDA